MRARIAGFLSAIIATTTAATAQTVDVTECLAISDEAKRKECFADRYQSTSAHNVENAKLPPGWTKSTSTDEMRGTRSTFVISPDIRPLTPMSFPYGDTTMNLAIACNDGNEWAYLVFSNQPNIVGDTPRGTFSEAVLDISWGAEISGHSVTQEPGSRFLHFRDDADIFMRIESSPHMIVEIPWYSQGRVQFSVSLEHGKQAVAYLRQQCR